MKDQLISFETSKLAKEKGFDWHSPVGYCIERYVYPQNYKPPLEIGTLIANIGNNSISSPSQSLLQKWLRDENNIYITACPIVHTNVGFPSYFRAYKNDSTMHALGTFKSYEDALESGLFEVLKTL